MSVVDTSLLGFLLVENGKSHRYVDYGHDSGVLVRRVQRHLEDQAVANVYLGLTDVPTLSVRVINIDRRFQPVDILGSVRTFDFEHGSPKIMCASAGRLRFGYSYKARWERFLCETDPSDQRPSTRQSSGLYFESRCYAQ